MKTGYLLVLFALTTALAALVGGYLGAESRLDGVALNDANWTRLRECQIVRESLQRDRIAWQAERDRWDHLAFTGRVAPPEPRVRHIDGGTLYIDGGPLHADGGTLFIDGGSVVLDAGRWPH